MRHRKAERPFDMVNSNWHMGQYRSTDALRSRIRLHTEFSTNPVGWYQWVLQQMDLKPGEHLLELGGGRGDLWVANTERLPDRVRVVVSDLSLAMLSEARRALTRQRGFFAFVAAEAGVLPFRDSQFDSVIANHVFYHVPNLAGAFSETRRVLRPAGRLYAATNGQGHMRELWDIVWEIAPDLRREEAMTLSFSLDNGAAILSRHSFSAEKREYHDTLEVSEVEPLVAYVLSVPGMSEGLGGDGVDRLREAFLSRIQDQGALCISKQTGLFVATRR